MSTVIYARVSSKSQEDSNSIENQLQDCRDYLTRNSLDEEVEEIYKPFESAFLEKINNLDFLRNDNIKTVVCRDPSRLCRRPSNLLRILEARTKPLQFLFPYAEQYNCTLHGFPVGSPLMSQINLHFLASLEKSKLAKISIEARKKRRENPKYVYQSAVDYITNVMINRREQDKSVQISLGKLEKHIFNFLRSKKILFTHKKIRQLMTDYQKNRDEKGYIVVCDECGCERSVTKEFYDEKKDDFETFFCKELYGINCESETLFDDSIEMDFAAMQVDEPEEDLEPPRKRRRKKGFYNLKQILRKRVFEDGRPDEYEILWEDDSTSWVVRELLVEDIPDMLREYDLSNRRTMFQ